MKIVYDDRQGGPLTKETMAALVAAGHSQGKIVVAHIRTKQQAREAIEAGIDGLAHLFIGESAASDFGKFAAEHPVFVIPMLTVWNAMLNPDAGATQTSESPVLERLTPEQRQALANRQRNPSQRHLLNGTRKALRQLVEEAVPVLAGTDSGAPIGLTAYGLLLLKELELLTANGLSPRQALASATAIPARIFGLNDRGVIQPGKRADLVMVEGNPAEDIALMHNLKGVWKEGLRVKSHD